MTNNEVFISELNQETIESMIYEIRGQKVMLDFVLAMIYGYETKVFNQQVKNNATKFDTDFRFQLNEVEWKQILRSKKLTANNLSKRRTTIRFYRAGHLYAYDHF